MRSAGTMLNICLCLCLSMAGPAAARTGTASPGLKPMASDRSARPPMGWSLRSFQKIVQKLGKAAPRSWKPLSRASQQAIERTASDHLARANRLVQEAYKDRVQSSQRAGLLDRAAKAYGEWEAGVRKLGEAGAVKSPVFKKYVATVWEAGLVQMHAALLHKNPGKDPARLLKDGASRQTLKGLKTKLYSIDGQRPANFRGLVEQAWAGLYKEQPAKGAPELLRENPLALLPRSWGDAAVQNKSVKSVAYTPKFDLRQKETWPHRRKSYTVRNDQVFVFVPGIVHSPVYTDLANHRKQIMEKSGTLALLAKTGQVKNPYHNAYAVADAIVEARRVTKNPNIKVRLVGYSQGSNSVHAFMQAKGRNAAERQMFDELRKNVTVDMPVDGAARGTEFADTGVALTKLFFGRSSEVPKASARLKQAEKAFGMRGQKIRRSVTRFLNTRKKLRASIDKTVRSLTGRDGASKFARARAAVADLVHDMLVSQGAESLTTYRGKELMETDALRKNLKRVPVINTNGYVPASRMKELLPTGGAAVTDQIASWRLMHKAMGLKNDGQVPLSRQRLASVLETAVDLRALMIHHWGPPGQNVKLTSVIPSRRLNYNESNYPRLNPKLHAEMMVQIVERLGSTF